MKSDKEIKKEFKKEASKEPDKYYPTSVLKKEGFFRNKCKECNKYFWNVDKDRKICGDASCSGGFDVVVDNPVEKKLSYIEVWKKIIEILEPRGYVPINRYPVVARWNPTTEFVIASITDFQPYVITGEVKPPAKKLVVPQFCLRFGDIDNVGITGSHCTGFVMIGQHTFVSEKEWDQDQLFKDIYDFIVDGVGLDEKELTIHEDAWAGGGSFGPCMEFFSRGVELFNQVYTMFEQTPKGNKPLRLKVLDMGLGMERVAWFSQGKPNIYEAVFPAVLKKLRSKTKVDIDHSLYNKFSKFSAYLNVDEVDNVDEAWKRVAKELEISVEDLREKIEPNVAIYSIAEHARSLLVALNDGGLPSNVGGGYNLRVIFRRAQAFIDKFKWEIDLRDVVEWHAAELKDVFPELSENLKDVKKILAVEKDKFDANKQKTKEIVKKIVNQKIDDEKLLELYDSNGILPEAVRDEAAKLGKKIKVPDNFFGKVAERHEKVEQIHQTHREDEIEIKGLEDTKILYYDDYSIIKFKAEVVKVEGKKVVLDKTAFYPTSGGQLHDLGNINQNEVVDIFKQGGVIVHLMRDKGLKKGDKVTGNIDIDRRKQLSQHHTATHVINAAAKKVLGAHINQAGAKKTEEKAQIDLTHYQNVSEDELAKIEKEANKLVKQKLPVNSMIMDRDKAEKEFGMRIYQGGAVPGDRLRIIEIPSVDVEACGGTHLKNTSEIEKIKIVKSSKIQDGIIRLVFVAGKAAFSEEKGEKGLLIEAAKLLGCEENQVVGRCEELFSKWKRFVKKKKEFSKKDLELSSEEVFEGDVIKKTADILKTQPEHIVKTISRFRKELDGLK